MARAGGLPLPTITDDRVLGDAKIQRSLRFNNGDSPSLTRTPSGDGNRRIFTFSCWAKRSSYGISAYHSLFAGREGSTANVDYFLFWNSDELCFTNYNSSNYDVRTTQKFRDTSAWYHLVLSVDSTQGTAANRVKIYVNGSQVTDFADSTYPSQNYDFEINRAVVQYVGENDFNHMDGYMAEVNFIDGQQIDASYFGFTDPQTGIWMPKRYEGTYGTNGFYLDFSDNSSTAALGIDKSPNGNDFAVSGVAVSDSVKDTPTNNFCTIINLIKTASTTLGEGNLFYDNSVLSGEPYATHKTVYGTMSLASGKWYWEVRATTISGYNSSKYTYGVSDVENTRNTQSAGVNYLLAVSSGSPSDASYSQGDAVSIYTDDLYKNGTRVIEDVFGSGVDIAAGDKLAIALDVDAGKVWFARNGTWLNGTGGSASTTLDPANHDLTVTTGKVYTPAFSAEDCGLVMNFGQDGTFAGNETAQGNKDGSGQGNFYYAVPTGFKAVCSANLPIQVPSFITPKKHFDILLYTGNGATQSITGLGFAPDFVWIKERSSTSNHTLGDTVRGANKILESNDDDNESEPDAGAERFKSFDPTGFTHENSGAVNQSGETYVAWCWKAGGAAVANTDGTLNSQVSVNEEAGFSIVSWTSTGTTGSTIGHGLSKKPDWIILKSRNTSESQPWRVYHKYLGATKSIHLNDNSTPASQTGVWNDTEPTSSVFTVGSFSSTNENTKNYIAYCWHEVTGYSKFGNYTGNGSTDGTYVPLGFRPAFLIIRRTDSGNNWRTFDASRSTFNEVDKRLYLDTSNDESTGSDIDFLSNGFKLRNTDNGMNTSSGTYAYMAFAEQPSTTPFDTFSNAR